MRINFSDGMFRLVGALLGGLFAVGAAQAMPAIQHWQTETGARVYFVPAPELPMVDIRVVFAAGSAHDGRHPGLAQMTNRLLDKGAAGLSADELAERLEGLGAELGNGALRDMAWVSLRSLSDAAHLQPALELLRNIMSKPDFNRSDFERERKRQQIAIRRSEQSPGKVAGLFDWLPKNLAQVWTRWPPIVQSPNEPYQLSAAC